MPQVAQWLYFGCYRQSGHYLFTQGMRQTNATALKGLDRFDGMLAPQDTNQGYVAAVSRLGGWGCSALSFWDYTVDKRQRSNSIVFAPSMTIAPEDLLKGLEMHFPEVWERLPLIAIRPEGA